MTRAERRNELERLIERERATLRSLEIMLREHQSDCPHTALRMCDQGDYDEFSLMKCVDCGKTDMCIQEEQRRGIS